jgi:hypothetical protein
VEGEQRQLEGDEPQIQSQQPEQLYDLQGEAEELAPATYDYYDVNMDISTTNDTDLLYDGHPKLTSLKTKIDSNLLDQDATPDTTQDDASNVMPQKPSNDTATEDDLGHEKKVEQAPKLTPPDAMPIEAAEPMDLDQNEEEAEDTTELDLHEFKPMTSLDIPDSVEATTDDHQPLNPTKAEESDLQMDNVRPEKNIKNEKSAGALTLNLDPFEPKTRLLPLKT